VLIFLTWESKFPSTWIFFWKFGERFHLFKLNLEKRELTAILWTGGHVGALLCLCTISYLLAVSLRLYYYACYRTGVSLRLYYYVYYRAGSTTLLGISQYLLYPFTLYPLLYLLYPRNLITIYSPSLDGSNIARVLL
jgi:hypothetical protein